MQLKKNAIFPNEDAVFHLDDEKHFFPHLHNHDFYEIFVVLSGKVLHIIDGRQEVLSAGYAALIHPQDCHKVATEDGCLVLCISCSDDLLYKISDLLKLEPAKIPQRHFFLPEEVSYLLSESKRVAAAQNPATCESHLKSILVTCLSRFHGTPVSSHSSHPEWFSILLARLSLPEVFTISTREISALAGYTPEYISRCFRKYLQTTLTEYTQKMRIHYARGLLISTDLSILDICYECGFRNLSHFYHCFQKIYGVSPKRYRDQNGIFLSD